jgi:pre-mRNA-splicing factor CWC22
MASPTFTYIFVYLESVVDTMLLELGEKLLKWIILQLKRALKRIDKPELLAAAKIIKHLVNQHLAH